MSNLGIWNNIPSKLFGIGDIHGDYSILEHVLVDLAKVCSYNKDNKLVWNKKNDSWLVFCGDLIDRLRKKPGAINVVDDENSDKKIILKLIRLNKQAEKYGGKVIILLGNHELLNFKHAFDYISPKGNYSNRETDFTQGSDFSKLVADNTYLTAKIGNWVFVHGGFCPDAFKDNEYLSENPIHKLNTITRKFLKDKFFFENIENSNQEKRQMKIIIEALYGVNENKSPLNCRHYGTEIENHEECEKEVVSKVFKYIFGDKKDEGKMVISHTPQFIYNKNINRSCNKKIWRLDTGMSRAFDEHYKLIENMIKTQGMKTINQLSELICFDSNRYISILQISDKCEKIVTQHKFARDTLNNKRVEYSEAIFTKYRLTNLLKSIEENDLIINSSIEYQKNEIIMNLKKMINFLDKQDNFINDGNHNICLINY